MIFEDPKCKRFALPYLRGASKRELAGMFHRQDGTPLYVEEARQYLMDCLSQGKDLLPLSSECEGFDYSEKGCPGHPKVPLP